jgi:predicted Zn-ribbon and HTH transcriptional regulator
VTIRKALLARIAGQPRSASSLARELGLRRADIDEELRHAFRSAEAAGYTVDILPARCRSCGFTFDNRKLSKPGKCPSCRGSRIFEAQIAVVSMRGE